MFGQNAVCLALKINAGRKKVSLVSSYFMSLFSMTADTGFYEVTIALHYPPTTASSIYSISGWFDDHAMSVTKEFQHKSGLKVGDQNLRYILIQSCKANNSD